MRALAWALLPAATAAQACDPSCLACSSRYPITAVPCDASDPNQRGWALGEAQDGTP